MAGNVPRVELLWWAGCPSHPRALEELRSVMADLGLDPAGVEVREVATDEAAREEGFVGSPTIRIDGEDVQPPAAEPAGLTCRIYRTREGKISPVPDPDDVREKLETALALSADNL